MLKIDNITKAVAADLKKNENKYITGMIAHP